jgi:hypothetical protein
MSSMSGSTTDHLTNSSRRSRWLFPLGVGIAFIGCSLRLLAARGDFWLDEVWTYKLVMKADSLWDLLANVKHDNNHFVNSLFVWLLGPDRSDFAYRIPAVISGTLSIAAFMAASRRRGTNETLIVGCLMASSFLLIQYSSEARGYAYLQLFCGLSYLLFEEIRSQPHKPQQLSILPSGLQVVFGFVCVFGLLSHLTFVEWYAGMFAGSAWIAFREPTPVLKRIGLLLRGHSIPLLLFPVVYVLHYQGNKVGGAEVSHWPQVAADTLSLLCGAAEQVLPRSLVFTAIFILMGVGGTRLFRLRDPAFIVCLLLSSVVPLVLLMWQQFPFVYPRHFLVNILACLLLCASGFSSVAEAFRGARILVAVGLMMIMFGNAIPSWELIRIGRGEYSSSLRKIALETSGKTISLGGDHDFRNSMMVEYFGPRVDAKRVWKWIPNKKWTLTAPEWAMLHSFKTVRDVPKRIEASPGNTFFDYHHAGHYSGLSGWNWIIYHRPADAPGEL